MNLNSDLIIETYNTYKIDKETKTQQELNAKNEDFIKRYPKIWLSFLDNVFELEKFKQLISIHEKSYNSASGNHKAKKFESDTQVSETLAKEYLYPVIGEPSKQDKKKAYKKAWKKANK